MNKKEFQNHELDRIASDLMAAARIREEEIEKIIAMPNLFESVKTRVKKEQTRLKPKMGFPVWNWQIAGAFAILMLAVIGTATAIIFRTPDLPQQASKPNITETKTQLAQPGDPSEIRAIEKTVNERASVRQADRPAERSKPQNRIRKTKAEKQSQIQTEEGEFYMLALGGNWEADAENLRIVRAELSRAELFALGLNLPVENETQKIKTDLLVGANGVPKAIRFIE
jgi:hypothetical protein